MSQSADQQNFFTFSDALAQDLRFNWQMLIKEFSSDEKTSAAVFDFLLGSYSEEHRFYHNLSHIDALLSLAENLKKSFSDFDSVKLAIWFHDAVYDPRRSDNEVKSAELAVVNLSHLSLPENKIRKIEKMILATERHDAARLDEDGKLFLDLDLSILGADAETYQIYARAVRREYFFVPEALYRRSRERILKNFLRREFIYYTSEMRFRLEARARRNVGNEIKELS
jgi:predicted metal-dependent HD superfamily phosphohydrolase